MGHLLYQSTELLTDKHVHGPCPNPSANGHDETNFCLYLSVGNSNCLRKLTYVYCVLYVPADLRATVPT